MNQEPESVTIVSKEGAKAVFEIGPLMPGYGATIANPLRRVLLSSLEGTAITSVKIKGVDHEFSTIEGVLEDVIEIILNLKRIRFRGYSEEPVIVKLSKKGAGEVKASDITVTSDVELINGDQLIATLTDKKSVLDMEITVERGRGYLSVEQRQKEKLPIGVIAVDAVFSPVRQVNFTVEDVRVDQRIDFNKIVLEVETDGSIEPEAAVQEAGKLLAEHFTRVGEIPVPDAKAPKKATKKAAKKDDDAKEVKEEVTEEVAE